MAQVEKSKTFKELKTNSKQKNTVAKKKQVEEKSKKSKQEEKKSFKEKLQSFFHGVKTETKRIHWPTKKELIKYSIATIVFILFCAIFFYIIDIIFALVHSLIK